MWDALFGPGFCFFGGIWVLTFLSVSLPSKAQITLQGYVKPKKPEALMLGKSIMMSFYLS